MYQIKPNLYLSNWLNAQNINLLKENKIGAIVNLCEKEWEWKDKDFQIKQMAMLHFPIADLPLTGMSWVSTPAKFIDMESKEKNVLIHCQQGISRSAALVLYYLMTRHDMTLKTAWNLLRNIKVDVCPSIGFMQGLSELEDHASFSVEEYTKLILKERFPHVNKQMIDDTYHQTLQDMKENETRLQLFEKLGTDNVDPIGYMCIEKLKLKFPGTMQTLENYTEHHPFD